MPRYRRIKRHAKHHEIGVSDSTACFFVFSFVFELFTIISTIIMNVLVSTSYRFNKLNDIKHEIFDPGPLFDFNINQIAPSSEYLQYKGFYTWQGTKVRVKSGRSTRVKTEIKPIQINTIYQNKFFYKKTNKSYFDYLIDSAKGDESCKKNYKKCGVLDSNNNTLCIPIEEDCPLNDLIISHVQMPQLLPEYNVIEVIESLTDSVKYIYYTNNKTDNQIITYFELSADKPCIIPDEHNWISKIPKEAEKTCTCKTYQDGLLYDSSFIEVGNGILMKTLYYDN